MVICNVCWQTCEMTKRLNELVWGRHRLIGLVLVVEEDLTCRYCRCNKHKWEVLNSSFQNKTEISKKGTKMLPLLTGLLWNLLWICQWTQKERLRCVLVWGRREWRREGGREEKTARRVYHQVRVKRERQAANETQKGTIWSSGRETGQFMVQL